MGVSCVPQKRSEWIKTSTMCRLIFFSFEKKNPTAFQRIILSYWLWLLILIIEWMFVQTPSAAQPSLANAENKFIISSKATKQTLGFNSESIERPKTKSCVKIWEWSQWKPGKKLAQDQGCTNCLIISTASFVRILEQFRKNSHNFFYGRSRTLLKQNINLASSQLKFYWYFKKICDYDYQIILHR